MKRLDELQFTLDQSSLDLIQQQSQLAEAVWRGVLPELPALLEQHAATQALDCVIATLNQWLNETFAEQIQQQLADYRLPIPVIQFDKPDAIGYEKIADLIVHERLYAALSQQINDCIKKSASEIIQQCEDALRAMMQSVQQYRHVIDSYKQRLNGLAADLRQKSFKQH